MSNCDIDELLKTKMQDLTLCFWKQKAVHLIFTSKLLTKSPVYAHNHFLKQE